MNENSKRVVIAQSIPVDTSYSKEKTVHVTFTLSKGVKKVMVPSVVGMNYEEAEKKIKSKGFTYKIVWKEKQNGKAYVVLSQSVRAGTKKAKKNMYQTYSMQKHNTKADNKTNEKAEKI